MDDEFIQKLRDYTVKQMQSGRNPETVSKLVEELMALKG